MVELIKKNTCERLTENYNSTLKKIYMNNMCVKFCYELHIMFQIEHYIVL